MVTGSLLNGTKTRRDGLILQDASGSFRTGHRPSWRVRPPGARTSARPGRGRRLSRGRARGRGRAVNKPSGTEDSAHTARRRCGLIHRSRCKSPALLCAHHFTRGRALARIIRGPRRARRRARSASASPLSPDTAWRRFRESKQRVRAMGRAAAGTGTAGPALSSARGPRGDRGTGARPARAAEAARRNRRAGPRASSTWSRPPGRRSPRRRSPEPLPWTSACGRAHRIRNLDRGPPSCRRPAPN